MDAVYELPVSFALTPANEPLHKQMAELLKKAGADQEETKPGAVFTT